MKIGVIGAGAIGLLVSSYFAHCHNLVFLLTRRRGEAEFINESGIFCYINDEPAHSRVKASAFCDGLEELMAYDMIFVALKSHQIRDVLGALTAYNGSVVFLQNGVSHIEQTRLIQKRYFGVVEHGAMKISENSVRHTGVGKITIGTIESLPIFDNFTKLSSKNFPIIISHDIKTKMFHKLAINAVINPLTALHKVRNGELLKNKELFLQMQGLFDEVCLSLDIFSTEKIKLWKKLINICQITASNKSSMLIDFENKRSSELETILGYVYKQKKLGNIKIPLIELIYKKLASIESRI